MNPELAALEEAITKQAREAAIRDVAKVFHNLTCDLYHLGAKASDLNLQALQTRAVELVTREKALLLAEQILRKNAVPENEIASQVPGVAIIDEEVPDDSD
jgi:hypothetical protein